MDGCGEGLGDGAIDLIELRRRAVQICEIGPICTHDVVCTGKCVDVAETLAANNRLILCVARVP